VTTCSAPDDAAAEQPSVALLRAAVDALVRSGPTGRRWPS
jgi:hypothetical protein